MPRLRSFNSRRQVARASAAGLLLVLWSCCPLHAIRAEENRADGQAPPGMAVVKRARGGAWFVAKDLKEQYDRLLDQARSLQNDLDRKGVSPAEARQRIEGLRSELEKLRKEIDRKKLLISPVKVHTQSETTMFDIGPEKLLVITGDSIVVEGWDKPQVKCVLEKTVLSANNGPVDDHLAGLKVIHRHGPAPNIVGTTATERAADEQKFLASPDGQKLNDRQRASRSRLVAEIADAYSAYRDFQGREIDQIEIHGLTYEEGNRQVTVGVSSQGGDGNLGSEWQRHATLTVYVPRCQAVALRGCLVSLDVSGLHASLLVISDASRDIDYEGQFAIRDLHGSLTVRNAPLDVIEGVEGNVTIVATTELANTGTQHANDRRTSYTPPPRQLVCERIAGDFTAWFGRVDLKLSDIGGRIDVRNEFGDTRLATTEPLPDHAHRILSEAGRIEVALPRNQLGRMPVTALTNCGKVITNARREVFDDTSLTTSSAGDRSRRNWRGFKTTGKRHPMEIMETVRRIDAVLTGEARSSGLDLISRAGSIDVTVED
ncbi:MAG: hypothetical protein HY290_04090 [Planctomycetia bacterium]|nr:hypothetical protein [Planctomycetia bacterium]